MDRPNKIRVNGVPLSIEYVDGRDPNVAGVLRRQSETLTGEVETDLQVIRVDQNSGPDVQREVVLHEALHSILYLTGHGDTGENVVQALGNGLLMLLRENPDVVAWVQGRG